MAAQVTVRIIGEDSEQQVRDVLNSAIAVPQGWTTVPFGWGMKVRDRLDALTAAGLEVEVVNRDRINNYDATLSPQGGTVVEAGTTVTLAPSDADVLDLTCAREDQVATDLDVPGPGRTTPAEAVAPYADGLALTTMVGPGTRQRPQGRDPRHRYRRRRAARLRCHRAQRRLVARLLHGMSPVKRRQESAHRQLRALCGVVGRSRGAATEDSPAGSGRAHTAACQPELMNEDEVVAAEGVAPNGDAWSLRYRPEGFGGRHYMALLKNGGLDEEGAGWDIPGSTEIGFSGGLRSGQRHFYLYGLATSRIVLVRAESHNERDQSEVATVPFPAATTDDGSPLRTFVLVRPPIEDVTALVGLDSDGQVVQRIPMVGPPGPR